ncbi:MAG: AAA family ATPase [Candidatus Riflebacteria bacterium]|nr:AAA family ATPase [Candidatus Riflebacteria bacterium]
MEELIQLSRRFLSLNNKSYKRYFLEANKLQNQTSIIIGQRGVGKTVTLVQSLLESFGGDILTKKAIYIPVDHFVVSRYPLYEIAEFFYNSGVELICFDEIHKYKNWSKELKSIHDTFPDLRIIASGSSALEIHRESHDLSRRAIVYRLPGLSLREFIGIRTGINLPAFSLEQIVKNHEVLAENVLESLEKKNEKILFHFREYLRHGYYPYFLSFEEEKLFHITLEQNIHYTLESDLCAVYPFLNGSSIRKIKKLLSLISSSVPFTPDLKSLKNKLEIGDERTLKSYFKYLEDSGIIKTFSKSGRGLDELVKPDKIYLNNCNQMFALCSESEENKGTMRETFFASMVSLKHKLSIPEQGDFIVDGKMTFEIGGRNKSFSQIKNKSHSFLALDDMVSGIGNKIPLWLFGFIY